MSTVIFTIPHKHCALQRLRCWAILGELDSPEGVKANVRAIRQILDQAGSGITSLMLARLTRQRDMLKTERFFNTFREHVAVYYISAPEFVTDRFDSRERLLGNHWI